MSSKKLQHAIKNGATVQIGVEGANFMHLLIKRIDNDPRFKKICLWDYVTESRNKGIKDWLRTMQLSQDMGLDGIGIICDIDKWGKNSRESRVQAVVESYDSILNIGVTENSITKANGCSYGFHVTPTHQSTGCLETSLLENASSDNMDCADDFVSCVLQTENANENKEHKIKVRALMAAKNPDMHFSDTANTNLWDWDTGSLNEMLTFIENIGR